MRWVIIGVYLHQSFAKRGHDFRSFWKRSDDAVGSFSVEQKMNVVETLILASELVQFPTSKSKMIWTEACCPITCVTVRLGGSIAPYPEVQ